MKNKCLLLLLFASFPIFSWADETLDSLLHVLDQTILVPGIGFTSYNAMVAGDIPFSMFYMTFLAILTLLGNLISDILYAVVDPRVRIA